MRRSQTCDAIVTKETARRIFRGTLAAIDIGATVERALARTGARIRVGNSAINVSRFREIVTIAFGKAAFGMAEALARVLVPEYAVDGILVVPTEPARALPGWKTLWAGIRSPIQRALWPGARFSIGWRAAMRIR